MQDLFQLLQFFGICGLVVPVLQDWRTLALACVSLWRGGGGALQASGLQLHPSTLAMYLFYALLAQTCTIFHSWSCSISPHLQFTSYHASCINLYTIAISYTILPLCTAYTFCMNCTSSPFHKRDFLWPMFLLLWWRCDNFFAFRCWIPNIEEYFRA